MSDLIRWFRYVDDVLAIFTAKPDLKSILCLLNSLHRNLKYTVEYEQNDNNYFLDVNITFTDDKFHTSTYVKPTNTGLAISTIVEFHRERLQNWPILLFNSPLL